MEGISKAKLEELKESMPDGISKLFVYTLIKMCKELDPWLLIENAPKDRRLLLLYPTQGQVTGRFNDDHNDTGFGLYDDYLIIVEYPTHYKELSEN